MGGGAAVGANGEHGAVVWRLRGARSAQRAKRHELSWCRRREVDRGWFPCKPRSDHAAQAAICVLSLRRLRGAPGTPRGWYGRRKGSEGGGASLPPHHFGRFRRPAPDGAESISCWVCLIVTAPESNLRSWRRPSTPTGEVHRGSKGGKRGAASTPLVGNLRGDARDFGASGVLRGLRRHRAARDKPGRSWRGPTEGARRKGAPCRGLGVGEGDVLNVPTGVSWVAKHMR